MRLRALQYGGGKGGGWQGVCVGDWIARQLPTRSLYAEPMAGMAGVLLRRNPSGIEILNDADSSISNWWMCVRDLPEEMEHRIAASPLSEPDFDRAKVLLATPFDFDAEAPCLRRAHALTVVLQCGVRHTAGSGASFAVRWKHNPRVQLRSDMPTIRPLAQRLSGVQLLARDGLDILARLARKPEAVVYVDPPYGGLRDYAAEVDRGALREALAAQRGACAVSGFDDDWDCLGWRSAALSRNFIHMGNQAGETSRRVERLWMNYPPTRPGIFG